MCVCVCVCERERERKRERVSIALLPVWLGISKKSMGNTSNIHEFLIFKGSNCYIHSCGHEGVSNVPQVW